MVTETLVKTCYLCGYRGESVTRIMYRHHPANGEEQTAFLICNRETEQDCFQRQDAANKEWAQARGLLHA